MIANVLAELGMEVLYITNNVPTLREEYENEKIFEKSSNITYLMKNIDKEMIEEHIELDLLFVIPHQNVMEFL